MQLPNFIIGGAQKSGTTSLYYQLKQHPEVFLCDPKEPRYFLYEIAMATEPEKIEGRALHFPTRTLEEYAALFEDSTGYKAIGEASAHYLFSPEVAVKIKDTIPDARMIFILRNPIDRAYSNYWHAVRLGIEDRKVEDALAVTESRVTLGRYAATLDQWFEVFAPEQVKLLIFDDFVKDNSAVFADTCRFLEIDDSFTPDMSAKNKGGQMKNRRLGVFLEKTRTNPLVQSIKPILPRRVRNTFGEVRHRNFEKAPPLPRAVVSRLADYYREDIGRLETMVDRDLSFWLSSD